MSEAVDFAETVGRLGEMWGVGSLGRLATVKVSSRQKTGLGRCYPKRGLITLNRILFEEANRELLLEVVCHEAAHLAVHHLHKRRLKPHGCEWKALMAAAGYKPRATIPADMVSNLPLRSGGKRVYLHRCEDCGNSFKAFRTDRRWRCRSCFGLGRAGKLRLVGVDPRKTDAGRAEK